MIKKHFALLAICLFFIAIITSACGGGGKTTPPSYPFIPVPTPTPTVSPTPEPTPTPTVSPTPTPTPEKFPLELSQTEFTVNVGATDNITVTLNGEDITQTATYTVDQEAIANVEQGVITGLSAGVAIVTVNAENAEEEKTFTVNVIDPSLPNLEVNPAEVNLKVIEEATVTVTLNGEDVTEQVTYTSDDESIATAEKGKITAQYNEGTAKIAVSKEGANSATITVNVKDDSKKVTLNAAVLSLLGYKKVENGEDYYDIKKIEGETIVTNLEIPAIFKDNEDNKYKITGIAMGVFSSCISLENVTIPNSVTTIEPGAFYYCYSLENVTIGNSVTTIREDAFYFCYSLKNVTIPNSVTTIGQYAFSDCQSLENVTIPNSVTTIEPGAFSYCTSLKNVTIPNSVTTIEPEAFYYCTSLENVTIPNSVTTIGLYAFSYCTSLENVTIPNSVTTIGQYAFCICTSLENVTIPNSVTTIEPEAFYECHSLENVTIGNSVTTIGKEAFFNCGYYDGTAHLTLDIPDSVTTIGDYAFYFVDNINYDTEKMTATGSPWGAKKVNGVPVN